MGVTQDDEGQVAFLVKWKGRDNPEVVTSRDASLNCPLKVISFYEAHLDWNRAPQEDLSEGDDDDDEDDDKVEDEEEE